MKAALVVVGLIVAAAALLFGLIQLMPYGRNHANPPVVSDYPWPSAESRDLAVRARYDCHSNETVWPWYSNIAPISWLVQCDVLEGREELNFSTWGIGEQEVDEAGETILEGSMPPAIYLPTHPQARLSAAEKQLLIASLPAGDGEGEEEEGRDDD